MGKDNLKAQAYPLDQGWGLDSGWKSGGSGSFDRDWGPDNGWSRDAESPKTRPGNGGASFAAWEKPADAVPEPADWPPPDRLRLPEASPPGFYIVPRSMSGERVLALLFTDKPHSHLVNRIKALNPTFAQGFKAGEMFILGNLLNPTACLREEADLMAAAAKVRAALEPLSEAEADFMARHQAEIALMLGGAGASLGLGTDVLKKGLMQVGETLRDIEYLHRREFVAHGHTAKCAVLHRPPAAVPPARQSVEGNPARQTVGVGQPLHLAPRPGYLHPQPGSPLEQRRRARPDTRLRHPYGRGCQGGQIPEVRRPHRHCPDRYGFLHESAGSLPRRGNRGVREDSLYRGG